MSSSSQLLFRLQLKTNFISVSNDFYKKYIVNQDYSVSTHNSFCSSKRCQLNVILKVYLLINIFN